MLYRDEKLGLLAPVFLLGFAAMNFVLPASYWMKVNNFDVLNGIEGSPVLIDYDRTIKRNFVGDWRIKVRRFSGDGLEWICATTPSREDYDPKTVLPEPVTLEWFAWSDDRCYDLPAGEYEITATWEINPVGMASVLFRRTLSVTDTFSVEAQR